MPGLLLAGITPKMSQAVYLRYGLADSPSRACAGMGMRTDELDTAQPVVQLVRYPKQQNDSIEAAARPCAAADLRGDRQSGAPEPVCYQPGHRRMRAQRIGYSVGTAVA